MRRILLAVFLTCAVVALPILAAAAGASAPAAIQVDRTKDGGAFVQAGGHELSNVVAEGCDGEHTKYDDLSGGSFVVPAPALVIWVKAGDNASGDGPGYGQRFDLDHARSPCDEAPADPEPNPCALARARDAVGRSPAGIDSDGDFWCTDLARWISPGAVWSDDPGPSEAAGLLPLAKGAPGDLALIDLFPGNPGPEHVAVVESLAEGTVEVIEANGSGTTDQVGRASYPLSQVLGFRALPCSEEDEWTDEPSTTTTTSVPPTTSPPPAPATTTTTTGPAPTTTTTTLRPEVTTTTAPTAPPSSTTPPSITAPPAPTPAPAPPTAVTPSELARTGSSSRFATLGAGLLFAGLLLRRSVRG